MAIAADILRQSPPSAGVWRHQPRKSPAARGLRDMIHLLALAIAGALTTGALASLILIPGPVRAEETAMRPEVTAAPRPDPRPVARPADLLLPPVCVCTLPPFDDD